MAEEIKATEPSKAPVPMSAKKLNQLKQKEAQKLKQQKELQIKPEGSKEDKKDPEGHDNKSKSAEIKVPRSSSSKDIAKDKEKSSSQNNISSGEKKPSQSQSKVGVSASHNTSDHKPVSRLAMFDHLQKKLSPLASNSDSIGSDSSLHPATIKLGSLYRQGFIRDDDDRVAALLTTFGIIIRDYTTPSNKNLSWDLDKHIRAQVQHLVDCRQHSMGMGNVIKFIRYAISQVRLLTDPPLEAVPPDINEADAKALLLKQIFTFHNDRLVFSRESIANTAQSAIRDGDVILTYGSSILVHQLLLKACKERSFRVVVVDSRPLCDGLRSLRVLSPFVPCLYCPLTGAATVMKDVTRVFLGASALLANGSVVAPAGTAMVAALAKERRVPVIIVAESYKFCDKVQLDAIVFNELGAALEVVTEPGAGVVEEEKPTPVATGGAIQTTANTVPQLSKEYRGGLETSADLPSGSANTLPFQVLNLRYDLMPIEYVSVVATEAGLIPPTSVPVLISELRVDDQVL